VENEDRALESSSSETPGEIPADAQSCPTNSFPEIKAQNYETTLKEIESLIDSSARVGTPEGDRLNLLTLLVQNYEQKQYSRRLEESAWWRITGSIAAGMLLLWILQQVWRIR
jgi:hypothetical protein